MANNPSSNDTAVFVNGGTIISASGTVWGLDNGQVEVNGVVDPTTANVIEMAYVNGEVWQENSSFLWWGKTSPSASWSPTYGTTVSPLPASTNPVSANDTAVFLPGQTITDAKGNTWSIGSNGQVLINGAADPTTANVIELAYVKGKVWQENGNYLWWGKTSPSASWSPTYGTTVSPLPESANTVSADNTVATLAGQTITDASHNTWSIAADGQVLINGAADPTTANVVELAYENGQVWQENASGLWWAKSSPSASWSPTYGTSTSPVPAGSTPSTAPDSVLTWVGGGDNSAANPAHWSPSMSPAPGDMLRVTTPSTLNIADNDLAGDTLTVQTNSQTATNINLGTAAQLSLQDNFSAVSVNVASTATVSLGSVHGNLTFSGGALRFIGTSALGGQTTFNDSLTGSGTIALVGAQGEGSSVTLNGPVDAGLTFNLSQAAPVLALNIEHPNTFAGVLDIGGVGPFGDVLFAGLQGTSGTLLNGVLDIFNGNSLVDSTRVQGNLASLTLDQTSSGVVLSQDHTFGGGLAEVAALPLYRIS